MATNSDEDVAAYNDEDEEGDEHLEEADFDGGIFSNHVGRLRNNKECWWVLAHNSEGGCHRTQ